MTSPGTDALAQAAEQIEQRRAIRRRRQRYWGPVDFLAAAGFLASVLVLTDNPPLHALVFLAYALASAVSPLLLQGADTWQHQRALQRFALAAAVGVAWMTAVAIVQLVDGGHWGGPTSTPLEILASSGIVATSVDRWRGEAL